MRSILPLTVLSLLSLSHAANIPITVGANAQLAFNPNVVTANVGDTLTFSYFPKNHSVVQSSFQAPCKPLTGGFFSGFQPLAAGPGPVEFVVTVNDTKPIWIYCAQTEKSHCQSGMAMVVNQPPPPSPNTLTAYKAAAALTNVSVSPPNIAGGIYIPFTSTSTSGSNSTGSFSSSGSSSSASPSGGSGGFATSSSGGSFSGSSSNPGSSSSPLAFTGVAAKPIVTCATIVTLFAEIAVLVLF